MRSNLIQTLLLAAGCLIGTVSCRTAQAQKSTTIPVGELDVALQYDTLSANTVSGTRFWMQGGSVQLQGRFWKGLGVVADVSREHAGNVSGSGVDLDLVTVVGGPRYSWQPTKRPISFYGQVLAGETLGFNSLFPALPNSTSDANNFSYQLGGGVDYRVSKAWSVRVADVDWLRTQLANSTTKEQNNVRIGAGIVLHFR